MSDRSSEADEPVLINDPVALAQKEAENALEQFDWGMEEVDRWLASRQRRLRVSLVLDLHRLALQDINRYAGNFRPAGVAIRGSSHKPVEQAEVPQHVERMLQYVEDNWERRTAVHLAAYVLWQLNWIHPFSDGNGRTARILSYMVLCAKVGMPLPGTNTIPEQISANKVPYYSALEKADEAFKAGKIDVTAMEGLLEDYLANQLVDIHEKATGQADRILDAASGSNDLIAPVKGSILQWVENHPAITGLIGLIVVTVATIIFS